MKNVVVFSFVIAFAAIPGFAQCVRDDVIISLLRGNAIDSYFKQAIAGVTVSVRKGSGSEDKVVAETHTDVSGDFDLSKLKKGRYTISVKYPNFDHIVTRLTVTKLTDRQEYLQIILAPPDLSGTDTCEGEAMVRMQPKNER